MRRFIEPLAPHKLLAGLIVLPVGICLLIAGTLHLFPFRRLAEDGPFVKLAISFGGTFVIVGVLDLLPEAIRWRLERRQHRKFSRFFGKAVFRERGIQVVTARRTIAPPFLKYLYAPDAPKDTKGTENGHPVMKALPEGVHSWAAEQDIRAVSYLAKLFAEHGVRVTARVGNEHADGGLDDPTIAIGLGFNGHTRRLAGVGDVFDIRWTESPAARELGKTDQIVVDGHMPLPDPAKSNGRTITDYCLVARIPHDTDPDIVHFVCAGRSADGTAAAGYFLHKKWADLADRFGDEPFAIVLKHERYVDPDDNVRAADLDHTTRVAHDCPQATGKTAQPDTRRPAWIAALLRPFTPPRTRVN